MRALPLVRMLPKRELARGLAKCKNKNFRVTFVPQIRPSLKELSHDFIFDLFWPLTKLPLN